MSDKPPDKPDFKPTQPPPDVKEDKPPARKRGRPTRQASLQGQLEEFLAGISMAAMLAGDAHCASVIARQGEAVAAAWANLAAQNRKVHDILKRMMDGGAWGQVIIATSTMAIPIAQHHGIYPKDWPAPGVLAITDEPEEPPSA